jgi:hypothetical protein
MVGWDDRGRTVQSYGIREGVRSRPKRGIRLTCSLVVRSFKRGRVGIPFRGTMERADAHLLGLNGGEINANYIGSGKVVCHVYRPGRRDLCEHNSLYASSLLTKNRHPFRGPELEEEVLKSKRILR